MRMKVQEIVQKNEMYYKNYVIGRTKGSNAIIAVFLILINGALCFFANIIFKRMNFIKEAQSLDLEGKEVMTWVDEQMQLTFMDKWEWGIIVFFIGIIGFTIWVYLRIKGYNLYKDKKIRWIPIIVMIVASLILSVSFFWRENEIMGFLILLEALQFIVSFKVLLPLELRESYGDLLKYLEWLSQWSIKDF